MNSIPSDCNLLFDDPGGAGGALAPLTPFPNRADAVLSVAGFRRRVLDHFHVDGDIDIVTDDDTAAVEVGIPLHAEVLAVDLGCGADGCSGIAPGISNRRSGAINVEDNFLGDAMNRKVTRDFDLAWRSLLDLLGLEGDRRILGHIEKVGTLEMRISFWLAGFHGCAANRKVQ